MLGFCIIHPTPTGSFQLMKHPHLNVKETSKLKLNSSMLHIILLSFLFHTLLFSLGRFKMVESTSMSWGRGVHGFMALCRTFLSFKLAVLNLMKPNILSTVLDTIFHACVIMISLVLMHWMNIGGTGIWINKPLTNSKVSCLLPSKSSKIVHSP